MANDRRAKLNEGVDIPSLKDRQGGADAGKERMVLPGAVPIALEVNKAAQLERAHYERLKRAEEQDQIVQALPVNLIRFSRFVNRSPHYFSNADYQELKERIRASGQIDSPIKVRPVDDGSSYRYEVVFGHTRLRIVRELGWETIPGTVQPLTDQDLVLAKFRENADRKDLSAYEQALSARELLEVGFQGDRKAMTAAVNRSNQWISHQLAIAGIPAEVMEAFPLLYAAGYDDLAELGRSIRSDSHRKTLLARHDTVRASTPAGLVSALCRLLQKPAAEPAGPERPGPSRVMDAQGQLLVECKPLAKGGRNLRFTADKEGFAEYLIARMDSLYQEFLTSTK